MTTTCPETLSLILGEELDGYIYGGGKQQELLVLEVLSKLVKERREELAND